MPVDFAPPQALVVSRYIHAALAANVFIVSKVGMRITERQAVERPDVFPRIYWTETPAGGRNYCHFPINGRSRVNVRVQHLTSLIGSSFVPLQPIYEEMVKALIGGCSDLGQTGSYQGYNNDGLVEECRFLMPHKAAYAELQDPDREYIELGGIFEIYFH